MENNKNIEPFSTRQWIEDTFKKGQSVKPAKSTTKTAKTNDQTTGSNEGKGEGNNNKHWSGKQGL